MADDKSTKKTRFDTNLALVTGPKGEFRKVHLRLPMSDVIRLREEARARGVTLDEYIVSLLNRRARTTKTQTKKKPTT